MSNDTIYVGTRGKFYHKRNNCGKSVLKQVDGPPDSKLQACPRCCAIGTDAQESRRARDRLRYHQQSERRAAVLERSRQVKQTNTLRKRQFWSDLLEWWNSCQTKPLTFEELPGLSPAKRTLMKKQFRHALARNALGEDDLPSVPDNVPLNSEKMRVTDEDTDSVEELAPSFDPALLPLTKIRIVVETTIGFQLHAQN